MVDREQEEENNAIHKVEVDTVPPPPGEEDPYSAPTRIGPMADFAVLERMRQAEKRAAEGDGAPSRPPLKPSTPPRLSKPPIPARPVVAPPARPPFRTVSFVLAVTLAFLAILFALSR